MVGGYRGEVAQEFPQTTGFGIFGITLVHLFQDGHDLVANDTKFVEQGRVECGIGVFLIGGNPLFLSSVD